MQHRDRIILQKVIAEIDIGEKLLGNVGADDFCHDEMQKRALSMTVINIDELVKNVSDEMRASHREVPWKAVAGMRDLAAHKYQTLRMEDVYNTVRLDFPQLKAMLSKILDEDQ